MDRESSKRNDKGSPFKGHGVYQMAIDSWCSQAVTHLSALVGITLLNLLCCGSSTMESAGSLLLVKIGFSNMGRKTLEELYLLGGRWTTKYVNVLGCCIWGKGNPPYTIPCSET
jgi:hypothetical protein